MLLPSVSAKVQFSVVFTEARSVMSSIGHSGDARKTMKGLVIGDLVLTEEEKEEWSLSCAQPKGGMTRSSACPRAGSKIRGEE